MPVFLLQGAFCTVTFRYDWIFIWRKLPCLFSASNCYVLALYYIIYFLIIILGHLFWGKTSVSVNSFTFCIGSEIIHLFWHKNTSLIFAVQIEPIGLVTLQDILFEVQKAGRFPGHDHIRHPLENSFGG